jgi:IS30 family transposase
MIVKHTNTKDGSLVARNSGALSIYRFIYRPRRRQEELHRFLAKAKATRGRRYFKRRREPIPSRRSIHERPQAIDQR